MAKERLARTPTRPERAAPRRDKATGPKPQTSPVLIIFMVFFILLSLVLGVFLYLAQEKIDAAVKNADAKAAEANTALKNQQMEQEYFQRVLRAWCGDPTISAEDLDYIRAKNQEFSASSLDPRNDPAHTYFLPLQKVIVGDPNAANVALRNGLVGPVDPNTGKPRKTMRERIEELDKELALTIKTYKEKETELAKSIKDFNEYKTQFNEQVVRDRATAVQRDYEVQLRDKLKAKDEAIDLLNKKMEAVSREVAQLLEKNKKDSNEERKQLEDKVRAAIDEIGKERQALKVLGEKRTKINFDDARGQILKVESGGESVTIDLGSSQNLQPGITFSVYGRGPGGKPLAEPKATIEVTSVLDATMARARVTAVAKPEFSRPSVDPLTNLPTDSTSTEYWITDAKQFFNSRNPILPGDLIFNPLWDPKERIHVFLAGTFDVDGNGSDDLEAFRRVLTERGVIIDGYLDPTAGFAPRGKLDYQTDYLLIGTAQTVLSAAQAAGVDPKGAKGRADEANVVAIQQEAVKKGVSVVRIREFLARMGFNNMRLPQGTNGAATTPRPSTPPPADAKKPDGTEEGKK